MADEKSAWVHALELNCCLDNQRIPEAHGVYMKANIPPQSSKQTHIRLFRSALSPCPFTLG